MLRVLIFLLLFSLVSAQEPEDSWVERDEAVQRLTEFRETLQKDTDDLYRLYYSGSEETLRAEMDRAGVQWSRQYLEPWSGWILTKASHVLRKFHYRHGRYMDASISVAEKNNGIPRSDLDYLRRGMERAGRYHNILMEGMKKKVELDAERGVIYDQMNAAEGNDSAMRRLETMSKRRDAVHQANEHRIWQTADRTAFSPLDAKQRVKTEESLISLRFISFEGQELERLTPDEVFYLEATYRQPQTDSKFVQLRYPGASRRLALRMHGPGGGKVLRTRQLRVGQGIPGEDGTKLLGILEDREANVEVTDLEVVRWRPLLAE